jgi:hypothetical protein
MIFQHFGRNLSLGWGVNPSLAAAAGGKPDPSLPEERHPGGFLRLEFNVGVGNLAAFEGEHECFG